MNLKDRIKNFHPDTDTGEIADALGVDEDEVIAAIHAPIPQNDSNPHDQIDAWLRCQEYEHCGWALVDDRRKPLYREQNWSKYDKVPGFFEIRDRDPDRRKYLITDDAIVVRAWIDGDYWDKEYPRDDEIAELILSLRKS